MKVISRCFANERKERHIRDVVFANLLSKPPKSIVLI